MDYQLSNLTLDPRDDRDYMYEWDETDRIPVRVDLRPFTGGVEDQLSVGSCTGNSVVSACECFLDSAKKPEDLSRLFNYWNSRQTLPLEYRTTDQGSTLREALRSAKNHGLPLESTWAYDESKKNDKPSDEAFTEALQRKIGGYYRIRHEGLTYDDWGATERSMRAIKHALASGYPVCVAMGIGKEIFDIGSNIYQAPREFIGNHAVLFVGYDSEKQYFIVENSWGKGFGMDGYFYCSEVALGVARNDMWVIKGFCGYETVGPNLVTKYVPPPAPVEPPKPAPAPAPIAPPPEPAPPAPIEPPAPPDPSPPKPKEKDKDNTKVILMVCAAVILIAWFILR
jgi:C1A family cysteine protease